MRKGFSPCLIRLTFQPQRLTNFFRRLDGLNVVSFIKFFLRHRVALRMMHPAKRFKRHPLVNDGLSVCTHANPCPVVDISSLSAYAALSAHQAGIHIPVNVVGQRGQRNACRDIVAENEVN